MKFMHRERKRICTYMDSFPNLGNHTFISELALPLKFNWNIFLPSTVLFYCSFNILVIEHSHLIHTSQIDQSLICLVFSYINLDSLSPWKPPDKSIILLKLSHSLTWSLGSWAAGVNSSLGFRCTWSFLVLSHVLITVLHHLEQRAWEKQVLEIWGYL